MPDPNVIAILPKNSSQEVRCSLTEYKMHQCADVRVYADYGGAGGMKPTQKGFCIRVEMLPALYGAVGKMQAEAHRLGFLTDVEAT
jgi:hypothetical protein